MYSCILRPYLPSLHDLGERKCYGQTQGSLDLTAISHGKPPKTNLTHQDGATTVGPASLSLPPPAVVAVRWIFGSCHCCAAGARLSTTVPPGHKRIPPSHTAQLSRRFGGGKLHATQRADAGGQEHIRLAPGDSVLLNPRSAGRVISLRGG